jgi:hypothetical protein
MKTIIVWLLITVSNGGYNRGNVTVVDRFPTAETCEFVRQAIPNKGDDFIARCIQATVVPN